MVSTAEGSTFNIIHIEYVVAHSHYWTRFITSASLRARFIQAICVPPGGMTGFSHGGNQIQQQESQSSTGTSKKTSRHKGYRPPPWPSSCRRTAYLPPHGAPPNDLAKAWVLCWWLYDCSPTSKSKVLQSMEGGVGVVAEAVGPVGMGMEWWGQQETLKMRRIRRVIR